jgi:hypothetical protein
MEKRGAAIPTLKLGRALPFAACMVQRFLFQRLS